MALSQPGHGRSQPWKFAFSRSRSTSLTAPRKISSHSPRAYHGGDQIGGGPFRLYSGLSVQSEVEMTDDETEREHLHVRQKPSVGTQIQRIQRKYRRKVNENRSLKDWWLWYWQHPVENLPFLQYLLVALFVSPFLCVFWFMDNDTSFIVAGAVGLCVCAYSIHRFRLSMGVKREMDKFKQLNLRNKIENIKMHREIERVLAAHRELKVTQKRLSRANHRNRENLKAFEKIEVNMKIAGQKQVKGMTQLYDKTIQMRQNWREELLDKERELMTKAFERFETMGDRKDGITHGEFKLFSKMLPKRYRKRFARMGTFSTFAGHGKTVLDFQQFSKAIDLFASMEVDQCDYDQTPYATPKHSPAPSAMSPMNSLDLRLIVSDHDLQLKQVSSNMEPVIEDEKDAELVYNHSDDADHYLDRDDDEQVAFKDSNSNSINFMEMKRLLPQAPGQNTKQKRVQFAQGK